IGNLMFLEISAYIFTTSGWLLVSSTLPTEYWKIHTADGAVAATVANFSNLGKICVTDLPGVSNCKDFPSSLALEGQLAVPFLLHACLLTGYFLTFLLVLVINTSANSSSWNYLCNISFSLYAHWITTEFFDSVFYWSLSVWELGAALYICWSGSFLCILGGSIPEGSFTKRQICDKISIYNSAASHSHISSDLRGQAKSVNQSLPPQYSNSSRMHHFDKICMFD
uniref:Claudin 10 n=1 Tax=Cyclopterus lumpus TaxID=8103 RepID=A0A8C2XGJ5_CYCLU